jgi:hypothetical protein
MMHRSRRIGTGGPEAPHLAQSGGRHGPNPAKIGWRAARPSWRENR